jgi:hypothetical protein
VTTAVRQRAYISRLKAGIPTAPEARMATNQRTKSDAGMMWLPGLQASWMTPDHQG